LGGNRIIANGTIKLAVFFEVEGGRNILGEDDWGHLGERGGEEEVRGGAWSAIPTKEQTRSDARKSEFALPVMIVVLIPFSPLQHS
jgi:hypothetical protein